MSGGAYKQKEGPQPDDSKFDQISAIHKTELKDTGFLSGCSADFISMFYNITSKYTSTTFIVDEGPNGEVRGFVFCTTDRKNYFNKFMKANKMRLISYPSAYLPLLKTITKKLTSKDRPRDQKAFDYDHEITYMAVKHKYKRTGVANRLIRLAEEDLKKKGVGRYYLQVFSENNGAIKFYESVGFEITQNITASGRSKHLMCKDLA